MLSTAYGSKFARNNNLRHSRQSMIQRIKNVTITCAKNIITRLDRKVVEKLIEPTRSKQKAKREEKKINKNGYKTFGRLNHLKPT